MERSHAGLFGSIFIDIGDEQSIEAVSYTHLDDLFIVPLDAKERPILLDIIEDRHERKSIIIKMCIRDSP